jgi:hypothetical protein
MIRSFLPASGLAAIGLAWLFSAAWKRSKRLTLPERLQRCTDDLQFQVYD